MSLSSRSHSVLGISVLALLAFPLFLGSLRTSGRVIVPEGEVIEEDLYAIASLVVIEGEVNGDLFAVAGELRISGTVRGDVTALVGGPAQLDGEVEGSLRVASLRIGLTGEVGDDAAVVTAEAEIGGEVGRDVLMLAGEAELSGAVGRDVRMQAIQLDLDGDVGGDVRVRVDTARLGPEASIEGDFLYQASEDASISDAAEVGGPVIRRRVISPVWARAVTRAVLILSVAGLMVAGLAAGWAFPATSRRALDLVGERPWASVVAGLGVVIGLPLLAVPLMLTLVGIPVALFGLVLWVLALVLGPIPAVTRLGMAAMRGRGGAAAGLVIGVLVWRGAIWLLPLVAGVIYLAALLLGVGSVTIAGWTQRRAALS